MARPDLSRFIAVYDDVLPLSVCAEMQAAFERSADKQWRSGSAVRQGLDGGGWMELNISKFLEPRLARMFEESIQRYFEIYSAAFPLPLPISPVKKLNDFSMKRYGAEQQEQFPVHYDAMHERSNRYLVFLWYLNDVGEGGETWFPQWELGITPKAGRLLIFPPYWMFQHAGLKPVSGDKYIVSTFALY